jgi:predicted transcriptional regulator
LQSTVLEDRPKHLLNRSRPEIVARILEIASKEVLKTHIMYKANLSHRQLESYLRFLLENGFIQEIKNGSDRTTYAATEKGADFLKEFSHVSNYMSLMKESR